MSDLLCYKHTFYKEGIEEKTERDRDGKLMIISCVSSLDYAKKAMK